jgi:hypothetical protein
MVWLSTKYDPANSVSFSNNTVIHNTADASSPGLIFFNYDVDSAVTMTISFNTFSNNSMDRSQIIFARPAILAIRVSLSLPFANGCSFRAFCDYT